MPTLGALALLQPGPCSGAPARIPEQWGRVSAGAFVAAPTADGFYDFFNVSATDASSATVATADGSAFRQDSAAATNSDACLTSDNGAGAFGLVSRPWAIFKIRLVDLADVRLFCGFTTSTANVMVSNDAPAAGYIGLQLSTDRGDVAWQWARDQDGGGAQALSSTGVAQSTAVLYVVLDARAADQVVCSLCSSAGAVLNQQTFGTPLPTSTTLLHLATGIETRANAAKQHDTFWAEVRLRPT